ncbi:MAG: V-type ATP synthase subunit E [Planctomycetota bacterium]
MPLKDLVARIRDDMARDVRAIEEDGRLKTAAIETAAAARRTALFKREADALRARLSFAALRERATREIEIRRSLLKNREILFDEVTRRFEHWLRGLPAADEKILIEGCLARGRKVVPAGTARLAPRAWDILGGKVVGFVVERDAALAGGLRLVTADGHKAADLSYTALAAEFWERVRPEVTRNIFGADCDIGGPAA